MRPSTTWWVRPPPPPVERQVGHASVLDVLDRVLDKGIVIDARVRISLAGIDLISVEARVVVASIETYLKHADVISFIAAGGAPPARTSPGRRPRARVIGAA